jgi:long-chain fatty acid transport protein
LGLIGWSQTADASSQDLFGVGARGAAMGGAVVSSVTGAASLYYNPAGLMVTRENRFTLGYQRADYWLQLNGGDYDVDSADNFLLGISFPLPLGGFMTERLALGIKFVLPIASVLLARLPPPEQPTFVIVEGRPRTVGLHIGMALRLFDWLYFGGGVVALSELEGGLAVSPNDTGTLGTVVRDELVADYAPILGLLVQPHDDVSIGLAFHDVSQAIFTFPITADLGPDFPIDVPLLNVSGIAQYDPLQISADVTISPIEGLSVAAGVSFKAWSAFVNPIENTTEAVPPQDPPEFEDIVVLRLGAELVDEFDEATLAYRLGIFLEPSPVPEQVGNSNFLDSDRIGLSAGFGLVWSGVTADVSFQFQTAGERDHIKDEAGVRDPENAGLPNISHSGDILSTAFEIGVAF